MAATLKWSDHQGASQELGPDGKLVWRDRVRYQVTEAPTEADAYAQLPYVIGSEHPVYGDQLLVTAIIPQQRGPNGFWEMEIMWGSDAAGSAGTVNRRPTISWSDAVSVEDVDRDYDGHPITNSVGDPPVNTPTRDYYDLILTYTRWEPFYNLRKRISIVNAINDDNFALKFGVGAFNGNGGVGADGDLGTVFGDGGGPLGVYKGECKCVGYSPVGEYEETQALVQCVYQFHLRERLVIKGGGTDGKDDDQWASGFDWRFLDQGNRGKFSDTSTTPAVTKWGAFYLAAGEESVELVRLNGYGKPFDDTIKVGRTMQTPLDFEALPAGASLDDRWVESDPRAAFLIYKKHKRIPFRGLIPLFK